MEGTARRSGVATPANGARLRNSQMQALGIMNAERLRKLRSFALDKGPELVGDFCPWAKWMILLLKALLENDDGAKIFISQIFGISRSEVPIRSPLQIVVSTFGSATEEVLRDAAKMADVRAGLLNVCRLTILLLVTVIGGSNWKWLIGLQLVFFVAQTNQLQFNANKVGERLLYQAVILGLYILDAVATPPTFASRFLLHLASLVCVFSSCLHRDISMAPLLRFPSFWVMLFYTPLWFSGLCLLCVICCSAWAFAKADDMFISVCFCVCVFCACVCVVRGLVYVSAGGLCGSLFLYLCCTVLICLVDNKNAALELVAPLPLVCALLSCFYTPFWVGSFSTSIFICTIAVAIDNVKAILWWFVWLAALHSLSYAFSRNFDVIAMCFLGSYFSYGCIL